MSSRQTRARSRTGGASSAGDNPATQQGAYYEPPSADLPGLYPVHDGSYGVNTHINIDSVSSRRKGRKSRLGAVNEDEEDRLFNRRMMGREGKRYGMEVDLKKVVEKTKAEAKKDDGKNDDDTGEHEDDPLQSENQQGVPRPELQQPEAQQPKTGPQHQSRQSGEQQAEKNQGSSPNQEQPAAPARPWTLNDDDGPGIRDDRADLQYQMNSHVPTFRAQFPADRDDHEKPPYTRVRYRSSDPHSLIHNRQPSAPPSVQTPSYYGTATGLGSSLHTTAFRPSSSRSFNAESALYGDATLRTPQLRASSTPAPDHSLGTTRPAPSPRRNQTTGLDETHNANSADTNANDGANDYNPDNDGSNDNGGIHYPDISRDSNSTAGTTGIQFGSLERPTYIPPAYLRARLASQQQLPATTPEAPEVAETPEPPRVLPTAESLAHLTPSQIRSAKELILDLSVDRDEARKIADILDEAAKNAPPDVSKVTTLFANRPRPRDDGAPPTSTVPNTPAYQTPPNSHTNERVETGTGIPGVNAVDFGTTGTSVGGTGNIQHEQAQDRTFIQDDADDEDDSEYEALANAARLARKQYAMSNRRPSRGRRSSWKLGSWNFWRNLIFLFLTILTLVWGALTLFSGGLPEFPVPEGKSVPSIHIPSWHDVVDRVCDVVPCKNPIPVVNWGSDNSPVSGKLSDTQSELVESLTPKIPDEVFVEQDKNSKLKITQDFWHALRQLIKEDDVILTLETAKKNAPDISDAHWLAIKSRLERGGLATPSAHTGSNKSWDNWVNQNQDSLKKMIGGIAIPRHEFMTLFKKEMQSSQKEIRRELMIQDARIKELVDTVAKLQNSVTNSKGLTRQEVKAICDAAVRRAIENAKLDAVATGRIREHAKAMFINQVNFFGIGSGAMIDTHYTSQPWKPPKDYFKFRSKNWYHRDGYVNLPPTAAISPWTEEGECYCSGRVIKGEAQTTNSISVHMSRHIIPQHLVVEHILPSSTLDPGSMPKDIEVWAYIEEMTLRDEVRAFSESHFPTLEKEKMLNEGYVKIGHFVYENKDHGDGIQIFKISDELATMKAGTDQVVIRAVSNYGGDRTCFYRLRMYGDVVEASPWAEWNGRE
ncbi:hypothetical protein F5Y05DRAFT_212841 [Hypoxylon sp. FL0543]|nr:hypothetical protein F5Y05DRAFT_212841 [Hypoxylon sp. FL0543]